MIATRTKLRSPLKWHGGKSYLARRIIALMPEHRVYIEPYLGGGSILLNKPKAEREVAGDLDGGLINFWEYLAARPDRLRSRLASISYDRTAFEAANCAGGRTDGLGAASAFLIRNRFSRGGLGKDFAWSDRLRGGQPGEVNAWETIRAQLPQIARRVREVEFHHDEALGMIHSHDGPEALIYCDPPYLHSTRTYRNAYFREMNSADHAALLTTLRAVRGVVLLSGYRSELYDRELADWGRVDFDMPNHSGQGRTKQRRVECVWSNRPLMSGDEVALP